MAPRKQDVRTRLLAGVSQVDSCWLWKGFVDRGGYGKITVDGKNKYIHRVAYELFIGPLEQRMTIDHICRVRTCVNPEHLQQVSIRTNTLRGRGVAGTNARKTHCHRGHPFTAENLYDTGQRVWRRCIACAREDALARYHNRKRAA